MQSLKVLKAPVSQLMLAKMRHAGGDVTLAIILFVQTNTRPGPIDPKSIKNVRDFFKDWRLRKNTLSQLDPAKVSVHLVNVLVDLDHPKPVVFHRPLNIFSTDGGSTICLGSN